MAICLAYFDGCTVTEVANRLGVPCDVVRTQLRDGLVHLRDVVAPTTTRGPEGGVAFAVEVVVVTEQDAVPGPRAVIDATVPPSGTGCGDCDQVGGWWVHLRRCAACGHVGCCDSSPAQHATAHFRSTGHPVVRSFEPGEDWFWDYGTESMVEGPVLAPPTSRPAGQPAPGPAGRVPADWRDRIH